MKPNLSTTRTTYPMRNWMASLLNYIDEIHFPFFIVGFDLLLRFGSKSLSGQSGNQLKCEKPRHNTGNSAQHDSRLLWISSIRQQFVVCTQVLRPSEKLKYSFGKYLGYRSMFFAFNCQGNYPKALEAALNIKKHAEVSKDVRTRVTLPYYFLGLLNMEMRDYPRAKDFLYGYVEPTGSRSATVRCVFRLFANGHPVQCPKSK